MTPFFLQMDIAIVDENDSPPTFDKNFMIRLSESFNPGHQIARVQATDEDLNSDLTYSISLSTQAFMQIDAKSGILTLTRSIDRETYDSIEVAIQVSDGVRSTEWKKRVYVEDVNDNAPLFVKPHFSFDISETAQRGAFVGKIEAKDLDSTGNQVSYSFISDWGVDTFSLDPSSGIITVSANELDHEDVELYILMVSASDSGEPTMTATSTVYVNVLDVNDNPPKCAQSSYGVKLTEDAPIGSTVLHLDASDPDSDENTVLTYSLDESARDIFDITENGTILTKRELDREEKPFYSFLVTVSDHPNHKYQLTSSCLVEVSIEDVNDETPQFEFVPAAKIAENSPPSTPIVTIRAFDKDIGRNAELEYLLEGSQTRKFSIGRIDGVIRSVESLDREEQDIYSLVVTAIDSGNPRLSSKVEVIVNVMDTNDNAPAFQQKHYSASVLENASVGMDLIETKADDMDSGENGKLRYSIISGDKRGDFAIDENSGIIRVNKQLDYERKNAYELTIQAEDGAGGGNSKYDTSSVTVHVLDTNDNPPIFEHSPYTVRVLENWFEKTTPIAVLNARDIDDPPYNEIEYSIRVGGQYDELFDVNGTTGEVYLRSALDREKNSTLHVDFIAMDSGSPRLSSTGMLTVIVEDLNDNQPEFENSFYEFHVSEDAKVGERVAEITAIDDDSPLHASVKYSLMDTDRFKIDQLTGELFVASKLDRESNASQTFTAIAQDSSPFQPLTGTATIIIHVDDVNDNKPEIIAGKKDFFIPPGLREGAFVFGVNANDRDTGENAKLRFSLISTKDSSNFDINRHNGVVTASSKFQEQASYAITVQVRDSGFPGLKTEQKFNVYLAEELVVPAFDDDFTSSEIRVDEDLEERTVVTSVKAYGLANEEINYAIAGGNVGGVFDVHPVSGEVFVNGSLDYETIDRYELWIKSFYNTKPLFSIAKKVLINVEDKNDNAPIFDRTLVKLSVREGLYPPFDINTDLYAYDIDSGVNADITYRLQDQENVFTVDQYSGLIKCNKELDRETNDRYVLKLEAIDAGTPRLSSTATILLTVVDVNDNAPRFSRLYSLNVTESTPVGTHLLTIETVDHDVPANANVTYKFITNPEETFYIHPFTGDITIVRPLDREVRDEYALRIQATDGAWKLETVISVTVQDDNDNVPTFDHDFYEFVFPYSNTTKDGELVGRVHALDRDAAGPNSALSYTFSAPSDFFNVDETSGIITTRKELSYYTSSSGYYTDNSYRIRVVATDAGTPPMSSECEVSITLVNGNNHKPTFNVSAKEIALPYSLKENTLIANLQAVDWDANDVLSFSIVGGNGSAYFDVETGGDIRVTSDLRSSKFEVLSLNLRVQDSGTPQLSDELTLNFIITEDNKFAPEFKAITSRIYIREDDPVGNAIVTVEATDQDTGANGMVHYRIIKGDPEHKFGINKTSGVIFIASELDYEKIKVYNILIEAKDQGFYAKSSTSSVKVLLHDVDDNIPEFDQPRYFASLKENTKPGASSVTQMIAYDMDSPKNSEIEYEIVDSNRDFTIEKSTGIVKATRSFDFEVTSSVDLKIRARNPGSNRFSEAILTVNIEGENEFYPHFKQPIFHFAVSEVSKVGGVVGQVEAVDNDAGKDGEVFYYFIGASNDAGFEIDHRTGIIKVLDVLDRESQNRYVLTVLAKNRGSVRGNDIDEAQVIIQVQDGNDPPVFRRNLYRASIREDAAIGTLVTTVSALDKDVRPRNSQFSYAIAQGDSEKKFAISGSSGEITVSGPLDRETQAVYNLTVHAIDQGVPPAIGSTLVRIVLEDINDSPPVLEKSQRQMFVKENSPPNTFVKKLVAVDPDLPPNAGPFKFFLLPGKHAGLLKLDSNTGILRTKATIDREQFGALEASVEIQDNGTMSARYDLTVDVVDENDSPSQPRSIDVIIKNYEGTFPGGEILDVRPTDPDEVGQYECKLLKGPENIFTVESRCSITAGRIQNGREYELRVLTNDGLHEDVEVQVRLNFVGFSQFAVQESVVMRFNNTKASKVLGYFKNLRPFSGNKVLDVLSMTVVEDSVECFLTSKENEVFLIKEDTLQLINQIQGKVKAVFAPESVIADHDPCNFRPCKNSGKCKSRIVVSRQNTQITEAGNTVFNSPVLTQNVTCECSEEFSGEFCEIQKNPCSPNPCQEGGQCLPDGSSFRCLCPSLRGGKRCEIKQTNSCQPNPCLNGGSCQNSLMKNSGFFCLCRQGYQGELCETVVDTCRENPCLNGGTCISSRPNYRCNCHDHYYGNHCQFSTFGFDEYSYASFRPLDATTNDISIIFASTKPNSLLVYNYGKSGGGRSDFLALELVSGKPRFSWGGSRTDVTRIQLDRQVDTGRWYKVTATRNNRVGSLTVEDCTESGEYCKTCQADDSRCFAKSIGSAGYVFYVLLVLCIYADLFMISELLFSVPIRCILVEY